MIVHEEIGSTLDRRIFHAFCNAPRKKGVQNFNLTSSHNLDDGKLGGLYLASRTCNNSVSSRPMDWPANRVATRSNNRRISGISLATALNSFIASITGGECAFMKNRKGPTARMVERCTGHVLLRCSSANERHHFPSFHDERQGLGVYVFAKRAVYCVDGPKEELVCERNRL